MYRRIEVLHAPTILTQTELRRRKREIASGIAVESDYRISGITGLMCGTLEDVLDAWIDMNCPRRKINKNVRFYFTEKGWALFGRNAIKALIESQTPYRVIARKEHEVSVYYRDEVQVAIFPRRKGRK